VAGRGGIFISLESEMVEYSSGACWSSSGVDSPMAVRAWYCGKGKAGLGWEVVEQEASEGGWLVTVEEGGETFAAAAGRMTVAEERLEGTWVVLVVVVVVVVGVLTEEARVEGLG